MLSNWLWISRCGDYWQQAELCTDGACQIMMMNDDVSWPSVIRGDWTRVVLRCLLFWVVFSLFIFLYCFVCQYQSSDWLWRPPLRWVDCVGWGVKPCSISKFSYCRCCLWLTAPWVRSATSQVINSFQSDQPWFRLTASVHDRLWESRSFCTIFIQDIDGLERRNMKRR